MPITIGVTRETAPGERRVALVPEVAGKFAALGARIVIEKGAGEAARFPDAAYKNVEFVEGAAAVLAQADVYLSVQPPSPATVAALKPGAVVGTRKALMPPALRAARSGSVTAKTMHQSA